VIRPLNLVMIRRDRLEEVLNDAVERGRMTADDAQSIVSDLVQRGRQQTESVLGDLESLLNRSRGEVETRTTKARKGVTGAVGRATKAAREAADPALAQADRARRTAGVGPSFPILGYDGPSSVVRRPSSQSYPWRRCQRQRQHDRDVETSWSSPSIP
jgi:polyhydroxyalkanoate synthesis regulator phasin